jgi:2-hydroxy-6-oxonona-2,4-dienedioate hydrolase
MPRLATFADDLVVDVVDALEVADAHVVGTSFGGYFALRAAAAHPDRITKLVELGWTFGAPVESTPLVMRIATQPFLGRLMTRITPNERMVRSMLKQIGLRHAVESGSFGDVEIAWFLALLRHTGTMRNEIDGIPRVMTMRGFNDETLLTSSVLAQVTAPAFFLWGGQDPMGGPGLARTFTARLPDARLELMPNAGHAPWMDDPDDVARSVGGFLRS